MRLGLGVGYTGLDLSEENVRKAAELGLEVRLADASAPLPVGDGEYDCVVCLELLEHLPAPLTLLGELRRVLRAEGRLVVSVPNPYSWVELYRELLRRPDPEGHLNAFTTPVMENLLALAGFRLERRLGTFQHKHYLTPEEELERKRLQKLKLAGKDRIMQILSRYRPH